MAKLKLSVLDDPDSCTEQEINILALEADNTERFHDQHSV